MRRIWSLGALGEGSGWDLRVRPSAAAAAAAESAAAAASGNLGTYREPILNLSRSWYQDFGTKILVPRFWYPDFGTKILVPRSWYQDLGTKMLVPRFWYQNLGTKTLVPRSWINFDVRCSVAWANQNCFCLLYTSPSPRDKRQSRMPSSA